MNIDAILDPIQSIMQRGGITAIRTFPNKQIQKEKVTFPPKALTVLQLLELGETDDEARMMSILFTYNIENLVSFKM